MSDDGFVGDWRVTEYVFDPDGAHRGQVRQHRHLEQLGDGRVRVTQRCEPDAALAAHPMGAFAGSWEFELAVDGAQRLYHGPDVVGRATQWAPGAMLGRGVWPRFGHDFESYAVLANDRRQLTGGRFGVDVAPAAAIVGVAVPATTAGVGDDDWPTLDLAWWPNGPWHGTIERAGSVAPLTWAFTDGGWTEERPDGTLGSYAVTQGAITAPDGATGVAQRVGPSLAATWWDGPSAQRRLLLVADEGSRTVAGFELSDTDGHRDVAVVRLSPA